MSNQQHQQFLEQLAKTKELVWPVIERYLSQAFIFPEYCHIPQDYQHEVDYHSNLVNDYPQRKGKYLRPSLLMNTALAYGADPSKALPVAAAMQLSEEWILLHDDIEDDSLERRGAPTLHRTVGKELAINAGDNLQTIQWRILIDAIPLLGQDISRRIMDEFYVMFNRTFLGQTIDIRWNQSNKIDLTLDDIYLILESKTCYYTISGPMRLGAIVAGAPESDLETIYLFGRYLGRAFQIIDDVLDLTSDFSGLKKQQFNDLYEGKRTVILSHLLSSADSSEQRTIRAILSKPRDNKTRDDIAILMDLIAKYHSIDYSRKLAIDFSVQAKDLMNQHMPFIRQQPYRQMLLDAIDFVVNRDH